MDPRRLLRPLSLAVLLAWAVYTASLATGHFLSLLPKYRAESAWLVLVCFAVLVAVWGWRSAPASSKEPARISIAHLSLVGLLFVLLAFVLYVGALSIGLLSDDFELLDRAAKHEFVVRTWQLRPLPLLVWAFLGSIVRSAWLLHALNIFLHGCNGVMVVALAWRLGVSRVTSFGAGALFLCFPASVEPVAWVSGTQDVLMTTGCLAFVLACSSRGRQRLVLPLSLLALIAALACKETAVVAPALAWVAWVGKRDRWNVRPVAVGLVLVCAYAALWLWVLDVPRGFLVQPSHYFTKELLPRLFSSLAVPFTSRELLAVPALGIVTAWLFAALLSSAALKANKKGRITESVARCAVWVLLPALPVWSAFFISADLQGSRYLYLAVCGWSILVAALLLEGRSNSAHALGLLVTGLLQLAWSVGVRSHLRDWQEAAEIREQVLASAVTRLHDRPCAALGFTQVPDSVRSAYVFRNGFLVALQGRDELSRKAVLGEAEGPGCTLRWQAGEFR